MRPLIRSIVLLGTLLIPGTWGLCESVPQLLLEPQGSTSYVTGLQFDRSGNTLYVAGWDKVVRVWRRPDQQGEFSLDRSRAYRVPRAGGMGGVLNALALSDNGRWLAVGGRSIAADETDLAAPRRIVPIELATSETLLDIGRIYLFDTQTGDVHTVRGHLGSVVALAFFPDAGERPLLASAGYEKLTAPTDDWRGAVRVWDVLKGHQANPYVAGQYVSKKQPVRPELRVFSYGQNYRDAVIRIQWGDGIERSWDLAKQQVDETSYEGRRFDDTLAARNSKLAIGQLTGQFGSLNVWDMSAPRTPVLESQLRLASPAGFAAIPRVIEWLQPSTPRGPGMLAVVVAKVPLQRDGQLAPEYGLSLITTEGRTVADATLWPAGSTPFLPALAVDLAGSTVAVAEGSRVRIYRRSDLLSGRQTYRALEGVGKPHPYVTFVERDADAGNSGTGNPIAGIAFRESAWDSSSANRLSPDDQVFDFHNGAVHERPVEWRQQAQPATRWRVESVANNSVTLQDVGGRGQNIDLSRGHGITAHAVGNIGGRDVLAVASIGGGEVVLDCFDISSGRKVRRCTGHTLPIRSLAFSSDSRFLVSAGDDHFMAVWSFTQFDASIVDHGAPPVVIGDGPAAPIVVNLQTIGGTAVPGDQLMGSVTNQGFQPFRSASDAYRAFWDVVPDTEVVVRRRRGDETQDVRLPAIPQIEDVRPLFFVFPLEPDGPERPQWHWIGWNPMGPYDVSDDQVESFLGWHFNSRGDELSTEYASADQYRDEFRRRGLIRELWERGELIPPPPPPPALRPELGLYLPDSVETTQGETVVTLPPKTAQLRLLWPSDELEPQVDLLVDGVEAGTFQAAGPLTWSAPLPPAGWQIGETRTIQARLKTREDVPQTVTADLTVRYQPPPPTVVFDPIASPTIEKQVNLRIQLASSIPGESISYRIFKVTGRQQRELRAATAEQEATVDLSVELDEGSQLLVVECCYAALGEPANVADKTQRYATIVRNREPSPLTNIIPVLLVGPLAAPTSVPIEVGQPVVVDQKTIAFSATFEGEIPIRDASWNLGEQQGKLKVDAPVVGKPQRVRSLVPLPVVEGPQTLRVLTRNARDHENAYDFMIEVRPPVPRVTLVEPQSGAETIESTVRVLAELEGVGPPFLFDLPSVSINGRELVATLNNVGQIQAEGTLQLGENRIEIEVSNRFNSNVQRDAVVVIRRQPPEIVDLQHRLREDLPFVDVDLIIRSPTDIQRIEVDHKAIRLPEISKDDQGRWILTLAEVPLRQGENQIPIAAWNSDGRSETRTLSVTFAPKPEKPPTVVFVSPTSDSPTTASTYKIRYLVKSESPLRRLSMMQNGTLYIAAQALVDDPGAQSPLVIETVEVTLSKGNNHFEVTAVNDGGQTTASVNLSTPTVPIRVLVTGLSEARDGSAPATLNVRDGAVRFDEVSTARVWVQGSVQWYRPDAELDDDRLRIEAWVNGFQQEPGTLDLPQAGAQVRRFSLPIYLNKQVGNQVELRVPGLVAGAQSQLVFTVDCRNPDQRFGVHLLVVGVGVKTTEKQSLVEQALSALKAKSIPESETAFTTKAFVAGKIYGPVVGERIQRAHVLKELIKIAETIEGSTVRNNVVLIYYQGGEIIYDADRFFLTTQDDPEQKVWTESRLQSQAIDSDLLHRFIMSSPGAHVLFLDVARGGEAPSNASNLPAETQAGLIRFAWYKNQAAREEARLIVALDRALEPPSNLGKVDTSIANQFLYNPERRSLVSKEYVTLGLEHYIPSSLEWVGLTQ